MLLIQHNADISLVNAEGLTAKQLSRNDEIKSFIAGKIVITGGYV